MVLITKQGERLWRYDWNSRACRSWETITYFFSNWFVIEENEQVDVRADGHDQPIIRFHLHKYKYAKTHNNGRTRLPKAIIPTKIPLRWCSRLCVIVATHKFKLPKKPSASNGAAKYVNNSKSSIITVVSEKSNKHSGRWRKIYLSIYLSREQKRSSS